MHDGRRRCAKPVIGRRKHGSEFSRRPLACSASMDRRVGVDAVMHEAGLTHGGFYAHFASKEALVAAVAAASLIRSAAKWDQLSRDPDPAAGLAQIVEPYLDRRTSRRAAPAACCRPSVPRWPGGRRHGRPSLLRFAAWWMLSPAAPRSAAPRGTRRAFLHGWGGGAGPAFRPPGLRGRLPRCSQGGDHRA